MTVSFRVATAVTQRAEGEFEADVPDKWQQGPGAFGGLVFGAMLRAARAFESDLSRVARTFACDIAGPVMVGKAAIRVRELRRGRNQTNLQIELSQGDAVLASALCTMSAPRTNTAPTVELTPPPEASQYEAAFFDPDARRPKFARHYEFRTLGALPFSGGPEPLVQGFVRELAGEGTLDTPELAALLDSFWPAVYSKASHVFPATTISYNAQFLPGPPIRADQPLFYRSRAITQHEGYEVELRELWTRERLVGLNQQTFAMLG
jgi:acyl-CoA thioesterase